MPIALFVYLGDVNTRLISQYEQYASALAGARQYAADVTDRSQRGVYAGRHYAADVTDRSHRTPWNGRSSYADSSARHGRASDPVGWSLLNSAAADIPSLSSSSSVWDNSSDLPRRRRRQVRLTVNDIDSDRAESPPSWQTQSLHGSQSSTSVQRGEPSTPHQFSRRRSAAEISQPTLASLRSTLAGPVFGETSSLADVDLWPSSRRDRDATSFTSTFLEDIDNDAEEITSTGAEAGSTASIGGDTESIDADSEVHSADFELGTVGAEVLVSSSSGSGAEIGVVDPPSSRTQYETSDYGPSTSSDMSVMSNLRNSSGAGTSRTAEHVDWRERTSQRRWRRFYQADLPSYQSSSAAASTSSLPISDWLEFDWTSDVVPRRLPSRRDFLDFSDWNPRDRDTSAASEVPRLRDYVAMRSRRPRPSYSGSGAASNSASSYPHECLPNCEICNGGPGRLMQPLNRYLSELAGDHRSTDTSSSGTRPLSSSYEMLASAASAVDDDDYIAAGSLASLRQPVDASRHFPSFHHLPSVPSFPWRESHTSSVDAARYPATAEFERRVRRVDERMSQMRRRLALHAEREPRPPPSLSHRLRERQYSRRNPFQDFDAPAVRRNYEDDVPLTSGFGSTGAEAVSDFINVGELEVTHVTCRVH